MHTIRVPTRISTFETQVTSASKGLISVWEHQNYSSHDSGSIFGRAPPTNSKPHHIAIKCTKLAKPLQIGGGNLRSGQRKISIKRTVLKLEP